MKKVLFVGLVMALVVAGAAHAATKRILIVGDSWAKDLTAENREHFPAPDVFDQLLAEDGFGQYETEGAVTAWGGRKASDWAKPEHLAEIRSELEKYPTIDIVHLIIGGNDFLGRALGGKFVDTTAEDRNAMWDAIIADIKKIVDTCLAVRPDIRVVIADYDYLNMAEAEVFWKMDFHGATQEELNQWFVDLGRRKLEFAQATPRCEYVQNWGTLQYWYGDPAKAVPYPGAAPAYDPYPGGDITKGMPKGVSPDGIHPDPDPRKKILQNAMDQYYSKWLKEPSQGELAATQTARSGGAKCSAKAACCAAAKGDSEQKEDAVAAD